MPCTRGKTDENDGFIGTVNIEAVVRKYEGVFVLRRKGEYVKAVVILPLCGI